MSIVVTAVFTPAEGQREGLIEALRSTMPAVHDEDGCMLYAIHDADDGSITMIEKWASVESLDAHGSGKAVAALNLAIAPFVEHGPIVTRMTAIPVGEAAGTL